MAVFGTREAKLDALLGEALMLDGDAREEFLAALAQRDASTHAELLELLQLAQTGAAWLTPPQPDGASAWSALANDATDDRNPSRRIGPWRLHRLVGRGGMGSVYEAWREDGAFVQKAALKLIRGDFASAGFQQRFAQERQILASLNHAGIAHLLDGGEAAPGQPYLAMEFVDGLRIDDYCDERQLDLDARLDLFIQAAQAVSHAHARNVVHRDLKPSNITVTDEGRVKLLDFGIAKVIDADAAAPGAAQQTATQLFTPDYATPEQINGESAGRASDIYQLGLLLYELCCGQRAQQPAELNPAALQRAICITDPPLPSSAAAASPPQLAQRVGKLTPQALSRRLRGDLDLIVMKALRKEPSRRYASVADLVDDLRRWQHHQPVRARPETWRYRGARFVRRHAWGVGGAVAIFGLVVAYAVTVSLQSRALAQQRDRAQAEARKAGEVKSLVLRLFQGADPSFGAGATLSARELLDAGWQSIDAELGTQPEVQVELMTTVGETYNQLGELDRAQQLLQQANALLQANAALPAATRAGALRGLGRVLTARNDFAPADALLQQAEALYRAEAGADADIAMTLRDRGQLALAKGDYAQSEALHRASLELLRQVYGERHRDVADALGRLGMMLNRHGRYREAEPLLRQALDLHRELLPPGHTDIAADLSRLGNVLRNLGEPAKAEALYREALALMIQTRGEDHTYSASIMNNLARALRAQQRYDDAVALLQQALAIRRKRLGENHPTVAMNVSDLGALHEDLGKLDDAERYYRQALALYPADHPFRASAVFNIGSILEKRGDLPGAERQYREALAAQRERNGAQHPSVAVDLLQLGIVLRRQGRANEAVTALREALSINEAHYAAKDSRIADVLLPLGQALQQTSQAAEAKPLLQRAREIRTAIWGADDARTREVDKALRNP